MASMHKGSQNAYLSFIGWFFSTKSEYVFIKEPWQKKLFANYISESSFIEDFNKNELEKYEYVQMLEYKKEDYKRKDLLYLSPVTRLAEYVNKHLKEFLVDFIVHGSISTLDYSVGWSDFDTLIIIKKDILKDPEKLLILREHILYLIPELYAIDPLQHHQFIITTENAILSSSYSILPSQVFNFSKSLLGSKTLKISKNRKKKNATRTIVSIKSLFKDSFEQGYMDHHKKQNIALEDNFRNKNTMYQLKYFLSCIMTLPTYYFDAIGQPCYKKYSFKDFYSKTKINSEILDKSSQIRKYWPEMEKFPYEGNLIPDWICGILGKDYFKRAYDFSSEISQSIIKY